MTAVSVEMENLAQLIKERRMELGLSVEDAARKADVGVKTWYRYESGSPIRMDKVKNVCRALAWSKLPGQEEIDISEYKNSEAWSPFIEAHFGTIAAILFTVGSDILLDYIKQDLEELAKKPKGTHIGELSFSWTEDHMPKQFLMNYDYEFLYKMKCEFIFLRKRLASADYFEVQSVMQELLIYLSDDIGKISFDMDENVERLLENDEACLEDSFSDEDYEYVDYEDQSPMYHSAWVFDLFDDADIVTCLYSDFFLTSDNIYHFDHWFEEQFYVEQQETKNALPF